MIVVLVVVVVVGQLKDTKEDSPLERINSWQQVQRRHVVFPLTKGHL